MSSSVELESRRQQPDDWPELLELANLLSGTHPSRSQNAAAKLLGHKIVRLGFDEMDRNRYYAMGIITCEFAKAFKPIYEDPDSLEMLVDQAVGYIRTAEAPAGDDSVDKSINPLMHANIIFNDTFVEATVNMPAGFRRLANGLHNAVLTSDKTGKPSPGLVNRLKDRDDDQLFDDMREDMFAGMVNLQSVADRLRGDDDLSEEKRQKIVDVMSGPEALRLYRGMSTIPLPAFRAGQLINRYVDPVNMRVHKIDWEEELARQAEFFAKDTGIVRRSERLVCPATTVPEMFPMMQQIAAKIIGRVLV